MTSLLTCIPMSIGLTTFSVCLSSMTACHYQHANGYPSNMHAGRANAEEMVRALRGLELMETGSADLHEQLLAHNTELQATGGTFAASLDEMHKLQRISGSVNSSKQVKDHIGWTETSRMQQSTHQVG